MTNRAILVEKASEDHNYVGKANLAIEMAKDGNAKFLARLITDKIKPRYFEDADKRLMHQGNWPNDAEFAAAIVFHDRGLWNTSSEEVKFYNSEQEMEEHFQSLHQASLDGDLETGITAQIYEWDLGPNRRDRRTIC